MQPNCCLQAACVWGRLEVLKWVFCSIKVHQVEVTSRRGEELLLQDAEELYCRMLRKGRSDCGTELDLRQERESSCPGIS